MFEVFATLCALGAGEPCRDALLPGHAAPDPDACAAALEAGPDPAAPLRDLGEVSDLRCEERPAPALAFEEVAEGVFVHRGAVAEPGPENGGDTANIAFVVGETGVAVIDAGATRALGEQAYLAVAAVTDLPIRALILTHMHFDHAFGAAPLREAGAEIIAHPGLARALAERSGSYLDRLAREIGARALLGTAPAAPDREAMTGENVDLGGRSLSLTVHPPAHTTTDLSARDSATGIVFAGDLVFDEHSPALDGSLTGWRAELDALTALDAPALVPGHGGPRLDWPEGAEAQAGYLAALEADTRAALADGLPLSEAVTRIGAGDAGDWKLFGIHNPRNATNAYTELEWE